MPVLPPRFLQIKLEREFCWRENSVDLFELLPSWNHFVAIKVLASHHPIAKLNKSTLLEDAYNTFGNRIQQKSDSGNPFNSREMENFTNNRTIG